MPSRSRSRRRFNRTTPPLEFAALRLESLEPRMLLSANLQGPVALPTESLVDPLAYHAVTYTQMLDRAAAHPYVAGELIVAMQFETPRDGVAAPIAAIDWARLVGSDDVTVKRRLFAAQTGAGHSAALFQLDLGEADVFGAMRLLAAAPQVLWSAPNFVYAGADPREYIPNDPQYGSQWHHPVMQNDLAWDLTLGNPAIIVGVTDDGVDLDHEDLIQNIWVNAGEIPGDSIDNDGNGYIDDVNGWDFITGNNDPNPNSTSNYHGTHVAGITAGRTDNAIGIAGTAGQATILPLQFYNGTWNAAEIAAAYSYAADNGARIVTTSYNVDGWVGDPVFTAGLQYMYDGGVLHFNSAGNNNQLNPPRQAFEQSLFVASTEIGDLRSSFSNYGTGIDLAAPGSSILSTLLDNTYGTLSGTSMATPNAAGAAALLWSLYPTWTREQIAAQLLAGADNIDAQNPGFAGWLGAGRVNSFTPMTGSIGAPKVVSLTGIPSGSVGAGTPITTFGVTYSQVMDPASVSNTANYELRGAGSDGLFGTGDDTVYTITNINPYLVGTNLLRFNIVGGPLGIGQYRFRVLSGGVENPFGTDLDGDANGVPGGHYERFFEIRLNDFADVPTLGGLMSASVANPGSLGSAGSSALYAFYAAAGEKFSAIITPLNPAATLSAEFVGWSALATAPAAGAPVVVPLTPIAAAGNVTLRVTGDAAGAFSFDVFRNVNVAGLLESGTPVAIGDSQITLGSQRYAALGELSGFPGGLSFTHTNNPSLFVDISATGTPLGLTDDQEVTITTTVGNSIFPAGTITVANNGGIIGEAGEDLSTANAALPSTAWIRALLPFWDDIDADTGNVYWSEQQVNGIDTLIVQWHDRPHFSNVGSATFQLQVFETGPVAARFVYPDVDFGNATYNGGANATIGVQQSTSEAYQFSYNTAVLSNGSVIDVALSGATIDTDEYAVDLAGSVGQSIDVVASGLNGFSMAGVTLELLDSTNTVVATAAGGAANYPLGIRDFVVSDPGTHTLRVSGTVAGRYSLLLTEGLIFDTETNNSVGASARSLDAVEGSLGRLSGGTVNMVRTNNPAAFVDISASGTPLNLADDGEATIVTTVGNDLMPAGNVTVGNNGGILAGSGLQLSTANGALPSASFTQALMPFWDDMDADTGNVYWSEQQVDGVDTLIVQWHNRPHFSNVGSATFQLQLFESGPVAARFVYSDVVFGNASYDNGISATVGYQLSPTNGGVFSQNTASIFDGDVIDLSLQELDVYAVTMTAGQRLIFQTQTPLDDPLRPQTNLLDPRLTVLDGGGSALAGDDNGLDGKNARLVFTAPAAGTYYVAVEAEDGSGDYVLQVREPALNIAAGQVAAVTDAWQTVTLAQSFADPIVVVGPLSRNDASPASVRIRNVTVSSFEIQVKEWNYLDGPHAAESVSFLVLERGVTVLGDGKVLVAGSVAVDHQFSTVAFAAPFATTPVVLASLGSAADSQTTAVRLNNVSTTGFDVRVQEEEAADGAHPVETVNYVALEPGTGNANGLRYDARLLPAITHKAFSYRYQQIFLTKPRILASMQTFNVADPANVRLKSANAKRMEPFLEEEQSADAEMGHAAESVGYLAFLYSPPAKSGGETTQTPTGKAATEALSAGMPRELLTAASLDRVDGGLERADSKPHAAFPWAVEHAILPLQSHSGKAANRGARHAAPARDGIDSIESSRDPLAELDTPWPLSVRRS